SLALSEYSADENQTHATDKRKSLPLLDLDSDDEEESYAVYISLDFNSSSFDDPMKTSSTAMLNDGLGPQLAQLTARMDDTLNLLRRNKPQVDFCRSHGRVEQL
ncbi:hypothetical protein As57867_008001, partial [Aphanomyces stellatus]